MPCISGYSFLLENQRTAILQLASFNALYLGLFISTDINTHLNIGIVSFNALYLGLFISTEFNLTSAEFDKACFNALYLGLFISTYE